MLGIFAMTCACGGGDDGKKELVLNVDRNDIQANGKDEAVFTVMYDGTDVTAQSSITVNADASGLERNVFKTAKKGNYLFQAQYEGEQSNSVEITAGDEMFFQKNLLLQMYTSTDCGYCPATKALLVSIEKAFPKEVFVVCYHGKMYAENPFATPESVAALEVLWDELGNRGAFAPAYYDYIARLYSAEMRDVVKERLTVKGEQGIALTTSVDGNKAEITAKIKTLVPMDGEYRLVVLLMENNCFAESTRYDNVFRYCLTDLRGDVVENITEKKEIVNTYTKTIPATVKKDDLVVVAYLLRHTSGAKEAVNSQGVKLGESLDYQMQAYDKNRNPWDEAK